MNKIIVIDDYIDLKKINDSIKVQLIPKNALFLVNTLKIDILKDTDLSINYNHINESKLNIEINVLDNVCTNIYEFKEGSKGKIKYHFNINSNSKLNIYKFYDINKIKEFVRIDLNGINASVDYNFKTISKEGEKYDITIYHNKENTISKIINNGVNIKDGSLIFNVSSFVYNGNKNCDVSQKSRIVNLTMNKCKICPNLYIDEYDVNANHSAYIGNFKDDELFYLMSRGISTRDSEYLLIKGFLLNNMDHFKNLISEICEKYWR